MSERDEFTFDPFDGFGATQGHVFSGQRNRSALGHCVAGVDNQIDERQPEFGNVNGNRIFF
ncbi:MAG: hypothetical protein ACM3Z4_13460 [Hyphomicrobiales bacterium]